MADITMKATEYEALLSWAEPGASTNGEKTEFLALRRRLDSRNGVSRYSLLIRWEELPQRPAPGLTDAPRGNTRLLELLRPPTREDVEAALQDVQYIPGLVYVTADPNGNIGFYELDEYPWE